MFRMCIVVAVFAFFTAASAAEEGAFNLKLNMLKLNVKLDQAGQGLIRNEVGLTLRSLSELKTEVHDLLSNKGRIESLLPKEKKRKSYIALEAAKRIAENIEVIEDAYGENKGGLSLLKRRVAAQRAYTSIEIACFHCHNVVRDQ